MKRREFINTSAIGYLGLSIPFVSCVPDQKGVGQVAGADDFKKLVQGLLKDWCDGMIKVQIDQPDKPELHGALGCPSCGRIHGRCMDAVYPFLHMAQATGDKKYLEAGIKVFEWSKNVSQEDGSWTVMPDPKTWRGITVFGAIALAEALHHHGNLLDSETRSRWVGRLKQSAEYVYRTFDLTFTNINYGFTALHALNLLGRVLVEEKYIERSRELAKGAKDFFTKPNYLLFGEGKPSTKESPKGLMPIDLGYNVEESLNGVVMYALEENDQELLDLLANSLEGHLEFMLPDGAWDNSWGTRMFKWSYWGSRTTDGCQLAFGMMSHIKPGFGTAAYLSTELLKQCTHDGLIHGGPHYVSHGIPPCVHHTFAHAKPLATLLDLHGKMPRIEKKVVLPRVVAQGVKEFPEVSTWLAAKGPWRATVSSYDWIYKKHAQQATGGALAVLYHQLAGPILLTSMAKYMLVEKFNQQSNPDGEDFALTTRVETYVGGKWYTNLYDLEAGVAFLEEDEKIEFEINTKLVDEDRNSPGEELGQELKYTFEKEVVSIQAIVSQLQPANMVRTLVLPIISPTGEVVNQPSTQRIEVVKDKGTIVVESNIPLRIKNTTKERVFNMVPGAEAIPIMLDFPSGYLGEVECKISFINS